MLKTPPIQSAAAENWPEPGQWTYADYQRLPDDGNRYEVIFGVLYRMNTPTIPHQIAVTNLVIFLGLLVKSQKSGVLLSAPTEVLLPDIATLVQPDVLFISQNRRNIIVEQRIAGVPDLMIEVLSPSSVRHDRRTKFDAYEQAGVPEYWIVNPKTHTVEVYELSGKEYGLAGEFSADEKIVSPLLGDVGFTADSIFDA